MVAPWRNPQGRASFGYEGFRFALYPRQGGHAPEFDNLDNLLILGRMLGRIHAIGAVRPFVHRPRLDSSSFGHASVALISERFIPDDYRPSYEAVTDQLLEVIDGIIAADRRRPLSSAPTATATPATSSGATMPRTSSISTTPASAPAVQDLWMMLSGDRPRQTAQLAELMEGYSRVLRLRPARTAPDRAAARPAHAPLQRLARPALGRPGSSPQLPLVQHRALLGRADPELREQLAALDEPPLELP